jgi:hypothetical protein
MKASSALCALGGVDTESGAERLLLEGRAPIRVGDVLTENRDVSMDRTRAGVALAFEFVAGFVAERPIHGTDVLGKDEIDSVARLRQADMTTHCCPLVIVPHAITQVIAASEGRVLPIYFISRRVAYRAYDFAQYMYIRVRYSTDGLCQRLRDGTSGN